MFNDFFALIFPKICESCNVLLRFNEDLICTHCLIRLPRTNYHLEEHTPLNKLFWGRVSLQKVVAYFRYSRASKVQRLLYQLKYEGNQKVGLKLGELYGAELKLDGCFSDINYIVPVPLHRKKFKSRGYNQSECFAIGLGKKLNIPVISKDFFRATYSSTQTKKKKYERWENVEGIFVLKRNSKLVGNHILLVDDVITTGATIEAATRVLLDNNCKVSVAAIACA